MQYPEHNPGCYHSMIKFLSDRTGINTHKEISTKNVWRTNKNGKKKLVYSSYDITVVDKVGNRFPYMQAQKRYDACGIEADHFIVKVLRHYSEFGIEVRQAGSYRDSLGGGWYSTCNLYEVDGNYFANMDCSCV